MKKPPRSSRVSDRYPIGIAAELSCLKPHMVDYLCRSGILVPSIRSFPGRGRARIFTFNDIVLLRTLAHLLSAGISVTKLKRALVQLQAVRPGLTATTEVARFLVTDGVEIYYRRSADDVLEQLTEGRQTAFRFVIEIERIRREVASALEGGERASGT